ncbi:MAG: hypothetical protein K2P81_04425 [Bacteriovoracaceae bacterium]|nr:hypothetical protein [Bacteriovoracaceae bacterium]
MKAFIAILITLSTFAAVAAEVESKCGQVADGVERVNPKTDAGSSNAQTSSTAVSGQ